MSWWKLTRVLLIEFEHLWYCLCGCLCILNSDVICKSRVKNVIANFKSCYFLLTLFYFLRNLVLPSVPHDDLNDSLCLPISWVGRLSQRVFVEEIRVRSEAWCFRSSRDVAINKLLLTRQCRARPGQPSALLLLSLMVSLSRWRWERLRRY